MPSFFHQSVTVSTAGTAAPFWQETHNVLLIVSVRPYTHHKMPITLPAPSSLDGPPPSTAVVTTAAASLTLPRPEPYSPFLTKASPSFRIAPITHGETANCCCCCVAITAITATTAASLTSGPRVRILLQSQPVIHISLFTAIQGYVARTQPSQESNNMLTTKGPSALEYW